MTPPDSLPPTPTPSPLDGLPETEASRAIRSTVAEVIGTLQRLHATLAVEAGRLTEEERRSGQGKLLDGEAAVLAQVAHAAADNPALLKGLAAKDGGVDPARFEGDALLAHLALHVAARDAARALAAEAAATEPATPAPVDGVTAPAAPDGAAATARPLPPLPAAIAALPPAQLAAEAQATYQRALDAQRAGDWAAYGAEIGRLGQILERLNRPR